MEGHRRHLYQVSASYYNLHGGGVVNMDDAGGSGGFLQWSIQETRDMLIVRAELETTAFLESKRKKFLWETIAAKMKEKGYHRSAEQCKSKWKNLAARYKECETMEQEGMRNQFPFYDDLRAIFAARMDRMLLKEAEGGGAGTSSKKRSVGAAPSSSSDYEENDDRKKRRKTAVKGSSGKNKNLANSLKEMSKQQREMEMQWKRVYEEREEEMRSKEREWRKAMEELEKERLMMERRWRETEEERRTREEVRAQSRDALINALLNKLI